MTITVANGGKVAVTLKHPFYTPDRGWVESANLKTGDTLLQRDGTTATIVAVTSRAVTTTVYNLSVENDHNYYVGASRLLVHNCPPTDDDAIDGIVWRALGEGEDPAIGLTARAPWQTDVSPLSHVAGKRLTPWISTSKLPSVAFEKYNGGHGVVAIDLSRIASRVEDVSGGILGGGRFSKYAQRDQEVLIHQFIPPDSIIGVWP